MVILSVGEFIEQEGHPRQFFTNLDNKVVGIHSPLPLYDLSSLQDNVLSLLIDEDHVILLKEKNKKINFIDNYVFSHLYNSICANVIDKEDSKKIKYNSILTILYYYTCSYSFKNNEYDPKLIVKIVCSHIGNLLTYIIDRENTRYKNKKRVLDFIDDLKYILNMELLNV